MIESKELISKYKKDGFVIIQNVLESNEVKDLRNHLEEKFSIKINKDLRQVYSEDVIKDEKFYSVFLRNKLIDSCKIIFGENFNIIPDFMIQINSFGLSRKGYKFGWHVDSASEGNAEYLLKDNYKFAKMGIFLQDNTIEYGGGINISPGSHKIYFKFFPKNIVFFIKKIQNKINSVFNNYFVKSKAGDVIIFDSRILHASSLPKLNKKNNKLSLNSSVINKIDGLGEHSKFVLYCNVCSENEGPRFMKHSLKRSKMTNTAFFNYSLMKYPRDYPNDFIKLIKERKVNIPSSCD